MVRSVRVSACAIVFALILLLSGCPYRSDVPLEAEAGPSDPSLLGSWKETGSSSGSTYRVEVASEGTYKVIAANETGTEVYLGHLSRVGNQRYLNLREQGSAPYLLFRLEISAEGDAVTLFPVTENITERFASSEELRNFVAANQNLSFFFEGPIRYARTVSP